jgi:hypothetical protein
MWFPGQIAEAKENPRRNFSPTKGINQRVSRRIKDRVVFYSSYFIVNSVVYCKVHRVNYLHSYTYIEIHKHPPSALPHAHAQRPSITFWIPFWEKSFFLLSSSYKGRKLSLLWTVKIKRSLIIIISNLGSAWLACLREWDFLLSCTKINSK